MFKKEIDQLSEIEYLKFKRGMSIVVKNITTSVLIYVLSLLLGVFLPVLITHLTYFIVRYFSFGVHMKSLIGCIIQSVVVFVIGTKLVYMYVDVEVMLWLGLVCSAMIVIIGPQPTFLQPIRQTEIKKLHIYVVLVLLIIWIVLVFIPNMYQKFIFYGIVIQSTTIMIMYIKRRRQNV